MQEGVGRAPGFQVDSADGFGFGLAATHQFEALEDRSSVFRVACLAVIFSRLIV